VRGSALGTLAGVAAVAVGGLLVVTAIDPTGAVGSWVRTEAGHLAASLAAPAAAAGAGYAAGRKKKPPKAPKQRGGGARVADVKTAKGKTTISVTGLAAGAAQTLGRLLSPLGADVQRLPSGTVVVTAAAGAGAAILAAISQYLPLLAAAA